jgi:hypothetical protein
MATVVFPAPPFWFTTAIIFACMTTLPVLQMVYTVFLFENYPNYQVNFRTASTNKKYFSALGTKRINQWEL